MSEIEVDSLRDPEYAGGEKGATMRIILISFIVAIVIAILVFVALMIKPKVISNSKITEGVDVEFRENSKAVINFNDSKYDFQIVSIGSDFVNFQLENSLESLDISEEKEIDLDKDGTTDILIKIESFEENKIVLHFELAVFIPCSTDWNCTSWGDCVNETQTRTCSDLNFCNTTVGKPAESQSCTETCTEDWNCTSWGDCVNETQTRTCSDLNDCGTTTNKPLENQSCDCTEDWNCTSWGDCNLGSQNRTCIDLNNCNATANQTIENQSCVACSNESAREIADLDVANTSNWKLYENITFIEIDYSNLTNQTSWIYCGMNNSAEWGLYVRFDLNTSCDIVERVENETETRCAGYLS